LESSSKQIIFSFFCKFQHNHLQIYDDELIVRLRV
jgi:hypothetical protein